METSSTEGSDPVSRHHGSLQGGMGHHCSSQMWPLSWANCPEFTSEPLQSWQSLGGRGHHPSTTLQDRDYQPCGSNPDTIFLIIFLVISASYHCCLDDSCLHEQLCTAGEVPGVPGCFPTGSVLPHFISSLKYFCSKILKEKTGGIYQLLEKCHVSRTRTV